MCQFLFRHPFIMFRPKAYPSHQIFNVSFWRNSLPHNLLSISLESFLKSPPNIVSQSTLKHLYLPLNMIVDFGGLHLMVGRRERLQIWQWFWVEYKARRCREASQSLYSVNWVEVTVFGMCKVFWTCLQSLWCVFPTGSVKKSKLTLRKSRRELRRKLGVGERVVFFKFV